jgi:choline kinase
VHHATDLKPLTPVAGMPLLLRTLRSLERAGCERAVVVLGYQPELIHAAVEASYDGPLALSFAYNTRYQQQNGLSVLAARPYVDSDTFVLMMADHIVSEEMMELARCHVPPPDGATLLVDYKLDTIFDMDDATKVYEEGGQVVAIGKRLSTFNCIDTGVFVCTAGLMNALQAVYERRGDASLSEGVQQLAAAGRMATLDIGNGCWQDVDTPAMLTHAEEILEVQLPTVS